MPRNTVAVVGAAETTELGVIPGLSQVGLHADAASKARGDCGTKPKDNDGIATAGETPMQLPHSLGIALPWIDGTSVGGGSFMIHVRHQDVTSSRAFRVAGPAAFREAGIAHKDVDHLMIYDAFAHLPIYGLEDLAFVPRGEAAAFSAGGNTAPGGSLRLNTNGGGLPYMHSGMNGISVCHGVGGMFAASGTIIFSDRAP